MNNSHTTIHENKMFKITKLDGTSIANIFAMNPFGNWIRTKEIKFKDVESEWRKIKYTMSKLG